MASHGGTLAPAWRDALAFLGMWVLMTAAMMLPSVAPTLRRYRGASALVVGASYIGVWTVFGAAVHTLGLGLAVAERWWPPLVRAVPVAAGLVVLLAGATQLSAWKAGHLVRLRAPRDHLASLDARTAWRRGVRLGARCVSSCAGFTAVLLVAGVMDLRAMAAVGIAVTAERLAPNGVRIARAVGAATVAAGLVLMARAAGLA